MNMAWLQWTRSNDSMLKAVKSENFLIEITAKKNYERNSKHQKEKK